jgi:G:T/U-mismatch repair DNA glycosylase
MDKNTKHYRVTTHKSAHPYEPFNCIKADKIVLGSIPPPRFCDSKPKALKDGDVDWFYGSNRNLFWILAADVAHNTLDTKEKRQNFCLLRSIGIVDIIKSCDRKVNNASDENIRNVIYTDMDKILRENQAEKLRLFFTSQKVALWFIEAIKQKTGYKIAINLKNHSGFQQFNYYGRTFEAFILHYPSTRKLGGSKNPLSDRREPYYKLLFN